jgi:sugar-specific transcriptional regulator TrmB
MDREDLLERLQDLDLTEYQSRAYLAAVHLGTGRPNELAEASGVPQARIYDVIDDLSDRGLVEVHEQSRGKEVSAPPPRAVLEAFKQRRVDRFSETVDSAISGLEQFHHEDGQPEGFVTMVATRESAVRHVRQAVESAEWWLSLALPVDIYGDVADSIEAALDRGVTVRLVIPEDDEPIGDDLAYPERLNLRRRPLADTMAVADREYGVFSTRSPRQTDQPYVITQESTLVFLFQNYFEQFWPGSTVLQADATFPRRYLDPWRAIIDLRERLRQGETLQVRVTGFQNRTQQAGIWEGPIVDYELSGPVPAEYTVVIPAKAALFVEIDGDHWEVGGRKATKAHIASDGLEVRRG